MPKRIFNHTFFIFNTVCCVLVCCTVLFLCSCVSMPDKTGTKNIKNIHEKEQAAGSIHAEKKTEAKDAKKLTVVYDDTEAEQEQPIDLLAEYKNMLVNISLKAVHTPAQTKNGKAFSEPFSAVVTDASGNPLAGISVTVKYPSASVNDNLVFASEDLLSDENGQVHFKSPLPEFSCNSEILFYVLPEKLDEEVLRYAEAQALRMPYKVYTDKIHKAFSVSILDYTQSGKIITTNSLSSSALLKALYKKGFRSAGNSDFINEIDSANIPLLHKNAAALFRGYIDYLIFGTVKYEKPIKKTEAGLYTAALKADIAIMNVKNGNIVLRLNQTFEAEDKGEWQLIETIRNKLFAPAAAEYIYYRF